MHTIAIEVNSNLHETYCSIQILFRNNKQVFSREQLLRIKVHAEKFAYDIFAWLQIKVYFSEIEETLVLYQGNWKPILSLVFMTLKMLLERWGQKCFSDNAEHLLWPDDLCTISVGPLERYSCAPTL